MGFLFKFDKGSILTKYEWVNKDQSDDEDNEEIKKDCAKELFMSADHTMITIGGGSGTAIFLDENLRFGQTEKCDTFDNAPLCSARDFSINTIEVFGFNDISCMRQLLTSHSQTLYCTKKLLIFYCFYCNRYVHVLSLYN